MSAGEPQDVAATAAGRGRALPLLRLEGRREARTDPLPGDPAWRAAWIEGRRAHPRLDLPYEDFGPSQPGAAPPSAAADFYLARALEAGVPGAWEHLQREYRRRLYGFLRRRGARRHEADQVLDEAWGAFATPPPSGDARTAIGTYDGRGSLHAWMATVLWRRLADRWRAQATSDRHGPREPDPARLAPDPLAQAADAETDRSLTEALEEAWRDLTPRELHAVVLRYRCQLPQTEIARVLCVGPPRVTRILQSAMDRLRDAVVARLGAPLAGNAIGSGTAALAATVERILARSAAAIEGAGARGGTHG